MKKKIRINESVLRSIISESIKNILSEKFQSSVLRGLNKELPSRGSGDKFWWKHVRDDQAHGVVGMDGMWSSSYFDKITDDMIDFVIRNGELSRYGFYYDGQNGGLYDGNGNRRYAMVLDGGNIVVFKNDAKTIDKLRKLSQDAGQKWKDREENKRGDGRNGYRWSTPERGSAFRDWRQTAPLWDDPEFRGRSDVNVPENWRDEDTWLGREMDNALSSYPESYKKKAGLEEGWLKNAVMGGMMGLMSMSPNVGANAQSMDVGNGRNKIENVISRDSDRMSIKVLKVLFPQVWKDREKGPEVWKANQNAYTAKMPDGRISLVAKIAASYGENPWNALLKKYCPSKWEAPRDEALRLTSFDIE